MMATEKRLIDANALLGKHCKEPSHGNCKECEWWGDSWCGCKVFGTQIDLTPTVDAVEVVHGQWVNPYMNRYGHPCHCCSICGFKASCQDKNYCPNCGAKMDGDGNG